MSLTRKQQILKIIVEDFIRTAKPIGSKYLIEKYNLPYSSATIRNDMQALENEGLIEKTHISSGRVPSANGYKYYVNNLRTSTVDNKFKNELKTIFDSSKSVEDVLRESCAILSHMTNLTSVVLGPKADNERLINIHLVPINDVTCTVLFVTDSGYVENKTFIISKKNKMQDIVKCLNLLDERLKGTKVKDLVEKLKEMKPILEGYMNDYSNLYNALLKLFYEFASNRSEVIGKSNLLKQPEFSGDAQEIQKILGLFDDPIKLEEIINQANEQLLINDSNDENSNVSIVSKEIVIPGENSVGKIAVIGPKRMDYDKVINYLDYIVSEILAHMNK
ncbi:MAG: heat-inducible transcriptional repressor HrcA [Mollicutes bacterium]|nr:heat-inducible transcriptional repressor HrcA [Mollicutes bacterium]MDD7263891.1 heat-inducible transcriptional repressor HrcA [bacterium]MDY4979772.1 heat-inducible transcriptional repressor HrcA [Candidatus Onthovivens sp.]